LENSAAMMIMSIQTGVVAFASDRNAASTSMRKSAS
jgi:hypothetical protein